MKILVDTVDNYLRTNETDYAILIKGKWGCGKTHFYKTVLTQIIEDLHYKPVYISLYGIADSNEISSKILLEIYPKIGSFFKSKTVQKMSELAKVILGSGVIYGIKPDFKKIKIETWMEIKNNYVLCFDDLERTEKIIEVLGYINNFIEHDRCKVLIIANEDEIKNEDYSKIKEKIVGLTSEYIPEVESVLSNLIALLSSDSNLKSFLDKHKDVIMQIFKNSQSYNIRILKHALQDFKNVYEYLKTENKILLNDFGIRLLFFTLAVSCAVKSGSNVSTVKEELMKVKSSEDLILKLHFSDTEKKERSGLQEFYDRFYTDTPYKMFFSRSILQYILNGSFDTDLLEEEIINETGEDQDPVLQSVRTLFSQWFELSDSDFEAFTGRLLNYIREGKVKINLYPRIFSNFSYFSEENLIKEDSARVLDIFKQGLKLAATSQIYNDRESYEIQEPYGNVSLSEGYKEIRELTNRYISEMQENWYKTQVSHIFDLFPVNTAECIRLLTDEHERYWSEPIFKYYSMEKLTKKLSECDNKSLMDFRRLLNSRYKGIQNIERSLYEDADNLRKLSDLLDSYVKQKEMKLSIKLLQNISRTAQECSEKLKKYIASTTQIVVGGEENQG